MTLQEQIKSAFECQYASGDDFSDAISLARREDGEYEQSLARLCFKWFCKGAKFNNSSDFTKDLIEANENVRKYPLFKKFISGTPLENDIPVWVAEAKTSNRKQSEMLKVAKEALSELMQGVELYDDDNDWSGVRPFSDWDCFKRAKQALATIEQMEKL